MAPVRNCFKRKAKYERILEYEGFDYRPTKLSSAFFRLLFPFIAEYWSCENPRCSGRLTKSRGVFELTAFHDVCIMGNGKTLDEGRDVEVGASADSAGSGQGPACANGDPQGAPFRSPIGDQLKFQARSPRPLGTLKKSTPEDETLKPFQELRLKKIISGHIDTCTRQEVLYVQLHGAPKPQYIPVSHARRLWPDETDAFMFKVMKIRIFQRYKHSVVVARLTGVTNAHTELTRSNSI